MPHMLMHMWTYEFLFIHIQYVDQCVSVCCWAAGVSLRYMCEVRCYSAKVRAPCTLWQMLLLHTWSCLCVSRHSILRVFIWMCVCTWTCGLHIRACDLFSSRTCISTRLRPIISYYMAEKTLEEWWDVHVPVKCKYVGFLTGVNSVYIGESTILGQCQRYPQEILLLPEKNVTVEGGSVGHQGQS